MKNNIVYIETEIEIKSKERVIEPLKKDFYILFFKDKNFSIFNSAQGKALINLKKYKVIKNKDEIIIYNEVYTIKLRDYTLLKELGIDKLSKEKIKKEQEINHQKQITKIIKKSNINIISEEYVLPIGRIDILAEKNNIYYIFEIKKGELKIPDIDQANRYATYFEELGFECKTFLIGKNYLEDKVEYALKKNVILKKLDSFKSNTTF